MVEPTQILWTPAGQNLPSLGSKALVNVSDGDTPNIRMPVRMLSIDTPEVTARSESGAERVDARFADLITWLKDGTTPVTKSFRDHILPKLESTNAGSLQLQQGRQASEFYKAKIEERLIRPGSSKKRNFFVRSANNPFDEYGRLLAYVAPSYSKGERESMTRAQRSTFNLDLIESGWAAPFVLFPSIPGELDLPLFLEKAVEAVDNKRGQYADFRFIDAILVLTGGGSANSTKILPTYLFDVSFSFFKLGRGAAIALTLLAVTIVLGMILVRVFERPTNTRSDTGGL